MASAEQKIADDKITADALYNGQVAKAEPSEGIFQCGKCKLWKVRFAMAQTRSGDEPMTVAPSMTLREPRPAKAGSGLRFVRRGQRGGADDDESTDDASSTSALAPRRDPAPLWCCG